MHFLKHMVVGRRCGLWKSGGIYKNLLRSQRPFRFHSLVCRAAWCKPQLHRAGLKPGHVEARDWAGTSHQLTNFPQTTLPLPLCWQKFCHLCLRRDYLGRGCTDEHRGLGPLWLQTLQNSWGWAEEPTGAQSMQNPGCRGCNQCSLRARLPHAPIHCSYRLLGPDVSFVTSLLVLTGGGRVFENKVGRVFLLFF